MSEQCGNCRFWISELDPATDDGDYEPYGRCRRNPPQIVSGLVATLLPPLLYGHAADNFISPLDMTDATAFPVTFESAWCGQFERPLAVIPC